MDDFIFNNANMISYFLYAIIVILVIWFISKTMKEVLRKKEIENYCKSQNITYSPSLTNIPVAIKSFSLFKLGGKNYFETAMTGNKDKIKFYLFDYRCLISQGSRNVSTYFHCVCIFTYTKNIFPKFYLFPNYKDEGFYDLETPNIVNFADDSEFCRTFILQSKQEKEVKEYFNQNIRDCFLRNHLDGYSYEGYMNYFVVAKYGCLKLNERLEFFNQSLKLFHELTQESSNS